MSIRNLLNTEGTNIHKISGEKLAVDVAGTISKSITPDGSLLLTGSSTSTPNLQQVLTQGNNASGLSMIGVNAISATTLNNVTGINSGAGLIMNSDVAATTVLSGSLNLTSQGQVALVSYTNTIEIGADQVNLNPTTMANINGSLKQIGDTVTLQTLTGSLKLLGIPSGTYVPLHINTSNGEVTIQTSSKKYKEDIENVELETKDLYNLQPVTYRYKDSKQLCIGYIAEDIPESLNKLVIFNDKNEPESFAYSMLGIYAIEEIKKLNKKIEDLTEVIRIMKQ